MKWEKVKLGDCCTNMQTGPFGSQLHQTDYSEDGIPVIMPKDMDNGKISLRSIAKVSEEHVERLARHKVKCGDILFSRRGDVGRSALIGKREENWLCGTGCLKASVNSALADSRFVFYQLNTSTSLDWFEKHAIGSTMLNLNTQILNDVPVYLPPLPIQQRIASILSAYDDLIENNQKQIKLLEEAAQRLYKEWFADLRFPGHEGVKVVDGVPEGWRKVRLDEVTSMLKRGISPKYDENGEFTVINQKCIRKNVVDYSESRKQSKKYAEELQLQENDTVICSTGIGTLGRVGQIYNVYQNSTFDSHVTLVRANKLIGKQFLFWSLKLLQPYLMSLGKGSTNQQELYKTDLATCLLLLPAEYIMSDFEKKAQELHDIIAVKTKQIFSLREARDRLLPKLMSGEIEV